MQWLYREYSKGMFELKKKVLEDDVANITRSGKHYVEDQNVTRKYIP